MFVIISIPNKDTEAVCFYICFNIIYVGMNVLFNYRLNLVTSLRFLVYLLYEFYSNFKLKMTVRDD